MLINDLYTNKKPNLSEGMEGQVVFSGTGANGSTYEIIQSSPTDFMVHANGKHIDTYGSLQRAMSVLKNEVPGLQQGVAEDSKPRKIAKADVLAKAPKPRNQQEYDFIQKYRKDLAQSYKSYNPKKEQDTQDTWNILPRRNKGVAEGSLNEFAITPDDRSDGKQAGRWLITYMTKDGTTKEKIMVGKNANAVSKYFEFKYRRKPLSVVPYIDDMDLRGELDNLGLDEQGMAEGSELKQAKRKYNQAAKDANTDQVGAGRKIDTMKNSLRQKDVDNKKQGMAEGMKAHELSQYCEELVAEKGWDAAYKHASMMANMGRDPAWNGVLKYLDAMKQGMAEGQTDYQKRRQRERDVDAGKPIKPEPRNPQNDYFARRKKEKDLAEVSLGDYRKKATVNKAVAQTDRFFGRNDAAKVAAADQTIAKREKGLARADARIKPYIPPAQDAEKQQRDLTTKYPNIDQLVADAERNRDPYYDRAEGNAYVMLNKTIRN